MLTGLAKSDAARAWHFLLYTQEYALVLLFSCRQSVISQNNDQGN